MQFYAYMYLREDGTPYYAGKGFGRRAFNHAKPPYPPKDKTRILIFERASEKDTFDTEKELIRNWGRKDLGTGCLRNRTDGGDGIANPSPEIRQKIATASSRTQKGRKHTPDHVEKVAAAHRGKKISREQITTLIEWHKTHPQTPEWKEKVEAAKKGRVYSEAARAHMSEAQIGHAPTFLGRKHTPETIAKQSAARKAYWARRRRHDA